MARKQREVSNLLPVVGTLREIDRVRFARWLRATLIDRGLTVSQLERRSGIKRQTIYNYLNYACKTKSITVETLEAIEQALDKRFG